MSYTLQDLYNHTITTNIASMADNLCDAFSVASAIDQYMNNDCQDLLINSIMTKTEVPDIRLCTCLLSVPSVTFAATFKCFIGFGMPVLLFDQFLNCIRGGFT